MAFLQYGIGDAQWTVVNETTNSLGEVSFSTSPAAGPPGATDDAAFGSDAFPGEGYPAVSVLSGQAGGFSAINDIYFNEGPWDWTGSLRANEMSLDGNLTIDGSITTTYLESYLNDVITVNGTLDIDAKANPTLADQNGAVNYGIEGVGTINIGATGTVVVENGSWLTAPNDDAGTGSTTFAFTGSGGKLQFGDNGSNQQATITNFVAGDTIDMPDYKNGAITISGNTVYVHEGTGNVTEATLTFSGGVPTDLVAQPDASGGTMLVVQATSTPNPTPTPTPTATDPNSPSNPSYSFDPNADAISSEGLGPLSVLVAPVVGPAANLALNIQNTVGAIGQYAKDLITGASSQTLQNDTTNIASNVGSDAASFSVSAPGAVGAGISATFGTEFGSAVSAGITDSLNANQNALKPPADTSPPSTTMPTSSPAANNIFHALNAMYTDTNANDLVSNISNVVVASSAAIIATNTDSLLNTIAVQNPTEGSQINTDGVSEQTISSGLQSLNSQQITFLYAESVGQSLRTAANELAAGQAVDQGQVFQAFNNPAMANLVSAAETNTGYAEGLGFLTGLATGGALTPNDAGFESFLDTNIETVGTNASGVLAAFTNSANMFLADSGGIADAIAKSNQSLA